MAACAWIKCALCLVGIVVMVDGYPTGAPSQVCTNGLRPGHGSKEYGVSPYKVSASSNQFNAKEPIKVTIESLHNTITFKGFVVQAQDSYGRPLTSGKWSGSGSKSIEKCGAVTHNNPDEKFYAQLTWVPTRGHGNVTFVATIAQTRDVYYHNIKADVEGHGQSEEQEQQIDHQTLTKLSKQRPSAHLPSFQHHQPPNEDISDFDPHGPDFPTSAVEAQPWLGGFSWPMEPPAAPPKRRPPQPIPISNEAVDTPESSHQDPFSDHSEHFLRFPPSSPFRFRQQSFRHDEPVEETFADFSVVHSPIRTPSSSGSTTFFFPNTFRRRPVFRQLRHFR